MRICAALLLSAVVLSGCVADQGRNNELRNVYEGQDSELEISRHGHSGLEVARLFNTGDIAEARMDYSGDSRGLILNEFYHIQMAKDPLRPTVLSSVGYVVKYQEDRGGIFLYQFFDDNWDVIAYMGADGSLYRHTRGREEFVGRFQLDDAVRALHMPMSGYGMDTLTQDRAIANMHDPDVQQAAPRARGVYLRTHRSDPPIVSFTLRRRAEAGQMALNRSPDRAREINERELAALRAERFGTIPDGEYGGLRYKDGQPVDENDVPLRPGSATRD